MPGRSDEKAALILLALSVAVFGPIIWLVNGWRAAVQSDPLHAWGVQWMVDHLASRPVLGAAIVLVIAAAVSGLIMLLLFRLSRRLAARLDDSRSGARGGR